MVKLKLSIDLNYEVGLPAADFIFNIHAARTASQLIAAENFSISQSLMTAMDDDGEDGNRYFRLKAMSGALQVHYDATVIITHHRHQPQNLFEVPVAQLPYSALRYLYPSRYCQSDRLHKIVSREFAHVEAGYNRVLAVRDWVREHITFAPSASNSSTSAVDTLIERAGVCRDFAHLMIALCRALNIPARFATGIDYGADPALGPIDFHAYVEAYLGDRWYIFDPSGLAMPMGLVRIGTGRDAADVAFATIFGAVRFSPPIVAIEAIIDSPQSIMPYHSGDALSTDGAHPARVGA